MGELGANFCRNDFLKSKLNEMDFRRQAIIDISTSMVFKTIWVIPRRRNEKKSLIVLFWRKPNPFEIFYIYLYRNFFVLFTNRNKIQKFLYIWWSVLRPRPFPFGGTLKSYEFVQIPRLVIIALDYMTSTWLTIGLRLIDRIPYNSIRRVNIGWVDKFLKLLFPIVRRVIRWSNINFVQTQNFKK